MKLMLKTYIDAVDEERFNSKARFLYVDASPAWCRRQLKRMSTCKDLGAFDIRYLENSFRFLKYDASYEDLVDVESGESFGERMERESFIRLPDSWAPSNGLIANVFVPLLQIVNNELDFTCREDHIEHAVTRSVPIIDKALERIIAGGPMGARDTKDGSSPRTLQ